MEGDRLYKNKAQNSQMTMLGTGQSVLLNEKICHVATVLSADCAVIHHSMVLQVHCQRFPTAKRVPEGQAGLLQDPTD